MNKFFVAPIINDDRLSMADVMIFYAVCQFAKWKIDNSGKFEFKAGNMFPSYETIAKRAHCSRRTAIRSLKTLEELGYISKLQGNGNSNMYTIDLKIEGVKLSRGKCHTVKKECHNVTGGVSQSHPNNKNNNINNKISNSGDKSQKIEKPLDEKTPEEIEEAKAYAIERLKQLQEIFSQKAKINNKIAMYGTDDLEKLTALDHE